MTMNMKEIDKLQKLYDKFIYQAEYYENHPMFPSYCTEAIANTYREAADFVKAEMDISTESEGPYDQY